MEAAKIGRRKVLTAAKSDQTSLNETSRDRTSMNITSPNIMTKVIYGTSDKEVTLQVTERSANYGQERLTDTCHTGVCPDHLGSLSSNRRYD